MNFTAPSRFARLQENAHTHARFRSSSLSPSPPVSLSTSSFSVQTRETQKLPIARDRSCQRSDGWTIPRVARVAVIPCRGLNPSLGADTTRTHTHTFARTQHWVSTHTPPASARASTRACAPWWNEENGRWSRDPGQSRLKDRARDARERCALHFFLKSWIARVYVSKQNARDIRRVFSAIRYDEDRGRCDAPWKEISWSWRCLVDRLDVRTRDYVFHEARWLQTVPTETKDVRFWDDCGYELCCTVFLTKEEDASRNTLSSVLGKYFPREMRDCVRGQIRRVDCPSNTLVISVQQCNNGRCYKPRQMIRYF